MGIHSQQKLGYHPNCKHLSCSRSRRSFVKKAFVSLAGLFVFKSAFAISLRQKSKTAAQQDSIPVTKTDKCPVCGMFVSPYPHWITQIQFKDGSYYHFDGMKCLFRFYFSPQKYVAEKERSNITRILVRDYFSLKFVDHDKAVYVAGSNVYGPMGHELIPFESETTAQTFKKDHFGQRLYRFDQVTPQLLDRLDQAKRSVDLEGIP